jgi:hypothetical protein
MTLDRERAERGRLLRVHEALIATQAVNAGPFRMVLVIDTGEEIGRMLASTVTGEAAVRGGSTVVVTAVDCAQLAGATRHRWPKLSERYSQAPPADEVWVLVIAYGGATLASFSRGTAGRGGALEEDGP